MYEQEKENIFLERKETSKFMTSPKVNVKENKNVYILFVTSDQRKTLLYWCIGIGH